MAFTTADSKFEDFLHRAFLRSSYAMGLIKGALTALIVFTFMMAGANKVSDQVLARGERLLECGKTNASIDRIKLHSGASACSQPLLAQKIPLLLKTPLWPGGCKNMLEGWTSRSRDLAITWGGDLAQIFLEKFDARGDATEGGSFERAV